MKRPTLGYSSCNEAVAALTMQGLTVAQIADQIGIKKGSVMVHQHYSRNGRLPASQLGGRIRLSQAIVDALAKHAERRGIGAGELAQAILRTVIESDLVEAVLDDGDRQ